MHPEYKKLNDNYYPIMAALVVRDGYICARCKRHYQLVVDHIVAVKRGGITDLENLQLLCKGCNRWKESETYDFRPANRGALGYEHPRYTESGALIIRLYYYNGWAKTFEFKDAEIIDVKSRHTVQVFRYDYNRTINIKLNDIYPPDLQHLFVL